MIHVTAAHIQRFTTSTCDSRRVPAEGLTRSRFVNLKTFVEDLKFKRVVNFLRFDYRLIIRLDMVVF